LRLKHDGGVIEGRFILAAAANTSCFGAGMRIAPAADPQDGQFDLVVVRDLSKWRLLSLFPRVYRGTHIHHPAVVVVRTRRLEVSAEPPVRLQADGEPIAEIGSSPALLEIRPGALRVAS
jgi:diacylglycerol kinase (ATP)